MIDLKSNSKVKELQAMLFPIHPIPTFSLTNAKVEELGMPECREFVSKRTAKNIGNTLPNLQGPGQDLQIPQSDRIGIYSVPLKHREPKDALRALLDARTVVDGITQEVARWPTECQVIFERVRHIEYKPPTPEPFYVPTGKEPRPRPICDELGTVIFRYCPTSVTNYFTRSCVGGSAILPPSTDTSADTDSTPTSESKDANGFACKRNFLVVSEAPPTIDTNTDLHFESRFESGNLSKVVKITDTYYQLHLRRDLYTQRHTQWFYFRISNTRSKTTYRFSIVNLCKDESLYNDGLRPLLYSTEEARTKAIGWQRCGDNISYYRNSDSCNEDEKEKHTLTFNVSFPHDHDIVYLAHCYPYTYTDLQEYLAKIVADPVKTRFTKLRLLCRTLAGNSVYYLTITAPTFEAEARKKKGIVITARVHPGETPSSWTMKGIIDFLTGDSHQARELRERFVFKLVPMLNPDGVIVGNNRCSLSGKDLNRQYRTVMRESYPTVWHTKLMIRRLLEECGIAIYCDLHAHSRKHNIFAYGCESKKSSYTRLSEQIFPLMLHKNAASKFSFENCKFHIEKGKEGTGRVVIWSMGVLNSYTIEASMGGSKMGSRCGTHFSTQDYEQIGKIFCETLLDFSDQDPIKERLRNKIVTRLLKKGSSAEEPLNIELTDYSSDEGSTSNNSASEDETTVYPEDSWDITDDVCKRRRYPCVPPSSPTYFPTCFSARLVRRKKKSIESDAVHTRRRKNKARRPVMDLPTTNPGSDLCYLTESADESFMRGKQITIRGRHDQVDANQVENEEQFGIVTKRECTNDSLILPPIVRPRSLSFGDDVIARDDYHSSEERAHCLQLTRCRDVTTSPCRDPRFRLISLRQQIWMGVQYDSGRKGTNSNNSFLPSPISCGVSKFASSNCCVENEILLRSCSQKLLSLQYLGGEGSKKSKRKSRKKSLKETGSAVPTEAEDLPREDTQEKFTKKRRSRLKWQKVVNLSSGIKEMPSLQASVLTIKADSLKLLDAATPTKPQSRQQKMSPRKKFHKGAVLATTITNISKSNIKKVQSFVKPLCKTTISGEPPVDLNKSSGTKTKLKAKKEKKTKCTGEKKRAASARILRNF